MGNELLEVLSELEHVQWMEWSKAVADEVSPERRKRWEKYWVPYDQLPEEVKEHDRVWARKVIGYFGGTDNVIKTGLIRMGDMTCDNLEAYNRKG